MQKKVSIGEQTLGQIGIGFIELNAPQKLNALDVEMFQIIESALKNWETDSRIAIVVISSSAEKAFCAGGDVKGLVTSMIHGDTQSVAEEFFTTEYYVDCLIRQYSKPTLCLTSGITMGGGIGIMNGCDIRVVTETSLLAMPENGIGLFPDVGGSYFLNHTAEAAGRFLGLTGARFSGQDAVEFGLADFFVPRSSFRQILADITRLEWRKNPETNKEILEKYFAKNWGDRKGETRLAQEISLVASLWSDDPQETKEKLNTVSSANPAVQEATRLFKSGSPLSFLLTHEQLRRGSTLDVKGCFLMEWVLALNCSLYGDFKEGVRALLIEKDGAPKWQKLAGSHDNLIQRYFSWSGQVPLKTRLNSLF